MTAEEYFAQLPEERREPMKKLRDTIKENLPHGFAESFNSFGIHYCIPHSTYPAGYHCDPSQPLPFLSAASQKNFIAMYHMGLYSDKPLLDWFVNEYPKHSKLKLDMGKSCVRFKKPDQIPYELIGELLQKVTPQQWIDRYEAVMKR